MKFVHLSLLVLVALVPVVGALWVFLRARAEKRLEAFVAPSLRARLVPRHPGLFNLQAALLLTGLFLVVFAAARPQWGHSAQRLRAKSRNVVVALDVSRSMLAADVRPNRLERAKADAADLIDSLEGDRCALVAFRRTGVLLCPLTTDHAFLRSTLESATPESAARGETDLGAAIRTSLEALDPAADDHNAILLISDGGDLRGGVLEAARLAAKRNVPVFTVGLGNPKAASPIPDPSGSGFQQYQGQTVKTKLEEAALVAVAKASGGRYVPLATAGTAETTLGAIYRRFLRQVAAKEQAEEEELRATERFELFLVPGLVLILLAACLSRGRFAGRIGRAAAASACLLACLGVGAADGASATNAPGALADEKAYVPPAEAQFTDSEIWNRGLAYYRAGDTTNALATLRTLTLSRTHGARAAEVAGALLHGARQAARAQAQSAAGVHAEGAALEPLRRAVKAGEESAEDFQIALRAAPDDPRARRNFARAVTGLKEERDNLHIEEVLAEAKGRDPKAMLTAAAQEALALLQGQAGVLTNEASEAVAASEALALRAERLADTLIPLKRQVLETVTNEQQAAQIVGDVEATRDLTLRAAGQLADLAPEAGESLARAETAFNRYWKGVLDPPAALTEDLRAQTNVIAGAARENGRDWQREAALFSQIFAHGFPAWVQQACQQDAPATSNRPPYTAEVAQAVVGAMQEIAKKQETLAQDPKAEDPALALAGLNRVRERMLLVAGEPTQLVDHDILMQTNAYAGVARTDGFSHQKDAYDATRAFRAKFPAWAQRKAQEIQQKIQQGDTNAVPFTQEQQAEVATRAAAVEKLQEALVTSELPPKQLEALAHLARIRELLPKDPSGGGGASAQPQAQPQQKPDDKKNDDKNEQPPQNDQNQPPEEKPQEPKEQQTAEQPQDLKDVEDLLRKAQERSDEHEENKRARMRNAPLPANERDW